MIDLTHAKYRAFKVWLWTGQNEFLKTVTNTVLKTPFEYDYKIPLQIHSGFWQLCWSPERKSVSKHEQFPPQYYWLKYRI